MASDPEKSRKPVIPDRRGPGRPDQETWTLGQLERLLAEPGYDHGVDRFEDGRPKCWPTMQLRIRGKAFDVYCEDPSDVTLDGIGVPVINGHTVAREDLKRGWFDVRLSPR